MRSLSKELDFEQQEVTFIEDIVVKQPYTITYTLDVFVNKVHNAHFSLQDFDKRNALIADLRMKYNI